METIWEGTTLSGYECKLSLEVTRFVLDLSQRPSNQISTAKPNPYKIRDSKRATVKVTAHGAMQVSGELGGRLDPASGAQPGFSPSTGQPPTRTT